MSNWAKHIVGSCLLVMVCGAGMASLGASEPVKLIFDTDMGNDIDDALALSVIHALESRGECELLAVTLSKDTDLAAPFVDIVNTFYGRGDIPIGVVRDGVTPEAGNYLPAVAVHGAGGRGYPHDLRSGADAPEAVSLLRKTLAAADDDSVVIVVVGFSTNLARLLESAADEYSPRSGTELVKQKCRLLSMMAGAFSPERRPEYNVHVDLDAARAVFAAWPTPIVISGYEIGEAIHFPAVSIERDFNYVEYHPVKEAYHHYLQMPYDRQTWDLTSVLYAVRPDRGYFGLSEPGHVTIDEEQVTQFAADPTGTRRYLTVDTEQISRVREALILLASQPPCSAESASKE